MTRRCLIAPALLAALAVATLTPARAKDLLTPGSKPTEIEPGREPFTFANPPTTRSAFNRDEPFLEGEVAYGYTGRVVTPIQRGSDIVAPSGSPAYGVPMVGVLRPGRSVKLGRLLPQLVWCAVIRKAASPKIASVCLLNDGSTPGGLMTTAVNPLGHDPYGGGEIMPAPFDLGAPVRVRYYLQSLNKVARIKAQIWVGDQMTDQWEYIVGDIPHGSEPEERLFSVGGGVIGITPDPRDGDRYTLRILEPLIPDGRVPLSEARNDLHATQ